MKVYEYTIHLKKKKKKLNILYIKWLQQPFKNNGISTEIMVGVKIWAVACTDWH